MRLKAAKLVAYLSSWHKMLSKELGLGKNIFFIESSNYLQGIFTSGCYDLTNAKIVAVQQGREQED